MVLRLILSDQLNLKHSWFKEVNDNVFYVMMETRYELEHVRMHRQKQLGIIANMRYFAMQIEAMGHRLQYIRLDDEANEHQIDWNLIRLMAEKPITFIEYQEADEYSVHSMLKKFVETSDIPVISVPSEHFYTEKTDLEKFFAGKKKYLMEHFYRYMRKRFNVLVDSDDQPYGGKWNYDEKNREIFPDEMEVPQAKMFKRDLTEINRLLNQMKIQSIGNVDAANFVWPIGRDEALEMLTYFVENLLPNFGRYQDAMTVRGSSLFHSRLSFALNRKIISPKEVVEAALQAYQNIEQKVTLPQVEGFIRQIFGWREYMRGIYWMLMPEYAQKNHLFADRDLPWFYWTGETDMNCLKYVINQGLEDGWAHHIQRLMIPGNFALLIGADPDQVDEWFLGMFHDSVEWAQMPNTRGMSQFADGGVVGTKPYAASANYISKMSDYCETCKYQQDKKYGENACPFNSLYWHFFHRNRKRLAWYPRLNQVYAIWDRMTESRQKDYLDHAEKFLKTLK